MAHGYAVAVPQRPGHGKTGGTYYEDQGGCANADFRKAGLNTAASIAAAIGFMIRQPFIRKNGAVAIGQSAGGWGVLALASQNYPPLKAVVAFAPGRGGRIDGVTGRNCAPDRLVAAARQFGEKTRIPSLWIYAENDSYFPAGTVEAAGGGLSAWPAAAPTSICCRRSATTATSDPLARRSGVVDAAPRKISQ